MDELIKQFFAEAAKARNAPINVNAVRALDTLLLGHQIFEQRLRSGYYMHERLFDLMTDAGCDVNEAEKFTATLAAQKIGLIFTELQYFGIRVVAPYSPAHSTLVVMPNRTVPTGYVLVGYYETREAADTAARKLQEHLGRTLGAAPRIGTPTAIAAFKKAIADFLAQR